MPRTRVRHAIATAGLLSAAIASGLTLDGYLGNAVLGESDVYGLVQPGAFGPTALRVATELPESALLAVLAVAMAAGAFARGRKSLSP